MTTDNHIIALIDAYLAGGLDDAERRSFDAHVATCADCAAAVDAARAADRRLADALTDAQPGHGFEERLIESLRPQFSRPSLALRLSRPIRHPMVRRIAIGVAASLIVGTVGYGMSVAVERQQAVAQAQREETPEPHAARDASTFGVLLKSTDLSADAFVQPADGEASDGKNNADYVGKPLSRSWSDVDGRHFYGTTSMGRGLETGWAKGSKTTEKEALSRTLSDKSGLVGEKLAADFDADGTKPAQGISLSGLPAAKSAAPLTLDVDSFRSTNGAVAASDTPNFTDGPNFSLTTPDGKGGGGGGGGGFGRLAGTTNGPVPLSSDAGGTSSEKRERLAEEQDVLQQVARSNVNRELTEENVRGYNTGWRWTESTSGNYWYRPQSAQQNTAPAKAEEAQKLHKEVAQQVAGVDGPAIPALKEVELRLEEKKTLDVLDDGILLLGGQTLVQGLKNPDEKSGAKPNDLAVVDAKEPATPEAAKPGLTLPGGTTAVPKTEKPIPPDVQQSRKVIRNGVVTFEVDSFDSAMAQVTKLAAEEGGFVATTSSDKLPNGKVRGAVTVRVPPDRLDTLVLKLRGMGDLKNQRISAEDVTKRYTDIESQLRAARAMEERILTIIKTGGDVKDLLEAEKQLGVWREKLELLEGEIRYFNNLISLSTLVVELQERDVRTPTAAFEVETVNTAVETETVEDVRAEVLKAIEQAKGRIIDSDLKKLEAGQLSATIKASVGPDAAGPVIDRLKQLGKLARLDISRKTMTQGGSGPIVAGLRVEKKETQFEIHIYNLANIEPRQTTSLSLAAQNVEAAYRQIIDQVKSAGGTIKSSQLNQPKADQTSATIVFQAPADKADVLLGAVRGGVDVMRMDVATNPDTQNTTEAKRGFAVQIHSLAHVPARETTTLQIAAADVPAAFRKVLEAATAGGRVLTSQLNEQDANNITGQLEFEVPRDKWSAVDTALREAGAVVTRSVVRSPDAENTVDSKVRLSIALMDEIRLSPRETINATLATRTVSDTFSILLQAARDAGARVVGSNLNLADRANPNGTLKFAAPRENAAKFEQALKEAGLSVSRAIARLPDGPMTVEDKVGFIVTVVDERTLKARESHQMVVVAPVAKERYNLLLDALRLTDALVLNSQLSVQNQKETTGTLEFVVDRQNVPTLEKALSDNADVFNRTVERSQDTQGAVDTKVRYAVTIKDANQQPPRQTFTLGVETPNIDKAIGDLETSAIAAGGRKIEAERARGDRKDVAKVMVDVPMARVAEVISGIRGQGEVTVNQSRQNENVPEGALSRAQIAVTFSTPATVAGQQSFGESLREGLSGALTGLSKVVQWVIFGLIVVVPCLILIWITYSVVRVSRRKPRKTEVVVPPDSYGPTPNPT